MEKLELVCPAGTLAALKAVVDAGADTVYVGYNDETNARNFPGLNFSRDELLEGVAYAHAHNCHLYVAINTFIRAGSPTPWLNALRDAEQAQVDAVILADTGLLDYCHRHYPKLRKHLSVQASASTSEAINYYAKLFDVKRVVLPRVLTIDEIAVLNQRVSVETEVFVFGGLCVMAEGRCSLSSYATGKSPNMCGVCSPASDVHYEHTPDYLVSRLAEFTINRFEPNEPAGYPTLCKGRFITNDEASYVFEQPTSLNLVSMLPALKAANITAIKIEGRQRGRAYTKKIVQEFRRAIDSGEIDGSLTSMTEGQKETAGSFDEKWQ
jgi:O2-independent ubiquinone biosynthesis protein UbiU